MRNPLALVTLPGFAFAIAMVGLHSSQFRGSVFASAEAVKSVTMVVDYGDGVQKHFKAIPWKPGMTVLSALQFASKHPRGVQMKVRGRGSTAFVSQIDDLENQGARGLNWIFEVDKKLADRSCGIHELKPKNTVLWKFDKYQ